jgi:hypothetical protein
MDKRRFGRQTHGEVILDICWDCNAIWFDQYESAQLTPGAVVDLFRLIHEHRGKAARPLADTMACPHCRMKLAQTQDLQRTNRLTYHRCPSGHGRLTTFFQFLREKQFIRSLSQPEIDRLKATVAQVRCSGCGAPIDIARDAACSFCRSPLSILDAAAVERTLAALTEAERRRTRPDADQIAAAFESLVATHRGKGAGSAWTRDISPMQSSPVMLDLVVEGISRLFER